MKTLQSILALLFILFTLTQCKKCINRELEEAKFINISVEEATKRLGKETSNSIFSLSYDMPTYRKGLLALVVVKDLKGEAVKEYTWEVSDCRKTHIWFLEIDGKWISVNNLTYNPEKILE